MKNKEGLVGKTIHFPISMYLKLEKIAKDEEITLAKLIQRIVESHFAGKGKGKS